MSPMDLSNMLGAVSPWEQIRRDGFQFSNMWGSEPMIGANGYAQAMMMQPNDAMDGSHSLKVESPMEGTASIQSVGMNQMHMVNSVSNGDTCHQQQWWGR